MSRRTEENLSTPPSERSPLGQEARDDDDREAKKERLKRENMIGHVKGRQNGARQDWKIPLKWQRSGD